MFRRDNTPLLLLFCHFKGVDGVNVGQVADASALNVKKRRQLKMRGLT